MLSFLVLIVVLLLVWVARLESRVGQLESRVKPVAVPPVLRPPQASGAPRPQAAPMPPPRPAASPVGQRAVPPPRVPPIPHTIPAAPVQQPPAPFDWEALVGVRLFSWVAGIALALGAIFFLRYSVQNGWLQPPVRMVIGIITGLGLLVACEARAARRYAITANALDASGIVILFATFFAAHSLWDLIPAALAFGLLVAVTAVAVLLSIRRDSIFIAVLGLLGGFSTPALLGSSLDNPLGLFGYLLLLNAGLAWVAYARGWSGLLALSTGFTALYQWQWVLTALSVGSLGLASGIFLVFPLTGALFLRGLGARYLRTDSAGAVAARDLLGAGTGSRIFDLLLALQALLPLLFAVYVAAIPVYAERAGVLFGFLLCLDGGLYAVARWRGPALLHLAGAVSTLLVFFAWANADQAAWPAILAYVALFVLFYLATGWFTPRSGERTPASGPATPSAFGIAAYAAPALLFMFGVLALNEPRTADPLLPFAVLLGLMAAVSAYAIAREDGLAHFLGAFFALGAVGLWSTRYLGPGATSNRVLAGLAIHVAFSLFFLLVPLVAKRWKRELPPASMRTTMSLALVGYLFLAYVAAQPELSLPPWPLFGALAILGVAIGGGVLSSQHGELQQASLLATLLILGRWTLNANTAAWLSVSAWAAVACAAFGLLWVRLARRLPGASGVFRGQVETAAGVTLVLAPLVALIALVDRGGPGVNTLLVSHLLLLGGLGLFAAWTSRFDFVLASVVPVSLVAFVVAASATTPPESRDALVFATPVYAAYLAAPVVFARRIGRSRSLHLAAVVFSGTYFLVARHALTRLGFESIMGILPLVQACLLGAVLVHLLRTEPSDARATGRLALVAGAVLAFATLVFPVQLHYQWLTIGWALESAALAWLYTRIPHRGLFWTSVGLASVVFVRLALNPAIFEYGPRGTLPILNWYLYTYLVAAVAFLVGAAWLRRAGDHLVPVLLPASTLLSGAATVLLFLLLNIEIADFFAGDGPLTFTFSAGFAQDLTHTLGWALFALALLAVGILRGLRAPRLAAIVLLTVTILKGFLHDTASLHGLYRVFSFVGLAACLALVALALQKFVLRPRLQDRSGAAVPPGAGSASARADT